MSGDTLAWIVIPITALAWGEGYFFGFIAGEGKKEKKS